MWVQDVAAAISVAIDSSFGVVLGLGIWPGFIVPRSNSAVLRSLKRDVREFDARSADSLGPIESQIAYHKFGMPGVGLVDQALGVFAYASSDFESERLRELFLVPIEICLQSQ